MNVRCPTCQTVFRVDPAKVPEAGVRARCSECDAVFGVHREAAAAPRPPAPALTSAPEAAEPVVPGPAPEPEPVAVPKPAAPLPRPVFAAPPSVAPPVVRPTVAPRGAGRGGAAGQEPAGPRTADRAGSGAAPAFNPFLSQDPKQKARRLARALVSDLVVYHPEKRARGLREGRLKELFDEEIKKSWEEYEEQVGKDMAESTTYFNDALNEILGDGTQVF